MKKKFRLEIRTPFGISFDNDIYSLTVNTEDGQITILPSHTDLISVIQFSPLIIRSDSGDEEILVRHGILTVDHNQNKVMVSGISAVKAFESVYFETMENVKDMQTKLNTKKDSLFNNMQYERMEEEMLALVKKATYLEKKFGTENLNQSK